MWFQTSRKIRRLERQLAHLSQQIGALTAHLSNAHQPAGVDVAAFLKALTSSQTSQIESTSGFIRTIHDIATDRMVSAMGRRAGRRRAQTAIRDERGRLRGTRTSSDCVLCQNPLTSDFSIEQFKEHQGHKGGMRVREPQPAAPRDETIEVDSQHVHADGTVHYGPAHPEPQYPLPVVTVDHAPSGAGSSFAESEQAEPSGKTNGAVSQ